jgi:hypothetical protein
LRLIQSRQRRSRYIFKLQIEETPLEDFSAE